jgi:hypothetical protein
VLIFVSLPGHFLLGGFIPFIAEQREQAVTPIQQSAISH